MVLKIETPVTFILSIVKPETFTEGFVAVPAVYVFNPF